MKRRKIPRLNMVVVAGRLTRDPEPITTLTGKIVDRNAIAIDNSYKKDDTWIDRVSYIPIEVWSDRLIERMKKGDAVVIYGKIVQTKWVDREMKTRTKVYIHVDKMEFLDYEIDDETQFVRDDSDVADEKINDNEEVPF